MRQHSVVVKWNHQQSLMDCKELFFGFQVQNGKNQMPAWEDNLEEEEIQAVAEYVYDQATNDKW